MGKISNNDLTIQTSFIHDIETFSCPREISLRIGNEKGLFVQNTKNTTTSRHEYYSRVPPP